MSEISVTDRQILIAVIGAVVTIIVVIVSHEFEQTERLAKLEQAIECLEENPPKEGPADE